MASDIRATYRTNCRFIMWALLVLGSWSCQPRYRGPEKTNLSIAVPTTPINFLPIYLARDLGYYNEQGLNVTIEDVPGGSKALQAMLGGSVDISASFFENAIELYAEGRRVQSFVTLLNRPGFVLAISPGARHNVRRVQDLKGCVIGVTTPGSASHHFVSYLLLRHGVPLEDVSIVGIGLGPTSVAAIERGTVDAGVLAGGSITTVQRHIPKLKILADTRTVDGLREVFGVDIYPAFDLIASTDWLRQNAAAARKLASAVQGAVRWMREHSPAEIRDRMPLQYRSQDEEIDLQALRETIPMLSRDGAISESGAEAVKAALSVSSEKVRTAGIDISKTYTNEFLNPRQ